jgi:hypothetical protein
LPHAILALGRGGNAGTNYLLPFDSLPPSLQKRAFRLFPEIAAAPPSADAAAGSDLAPARRCVLAPPPARKRLTRRTDAGAERLLFLRRAFEAAGVTDETSRARVTAELDLRVKRLWAAGVPGWRPIARNAEHDLYELLRETGAELSDTELRALCQVPRSYVTRFSRRKHRKTHTFLTDSKAFHDALPGVRRERPTSPLQVLCGDGTALDVLFLRPDGTQWKVWLILWLDIATNRLFGNAYARPKGGGVRQEHVAASFACLATAIGLPEVVYVDRGSEYGWADRLESAGLCRVIRALPYNARAKPIEPVIRVLGAHFLSQIPGYMGSDRFKKKSETVGRPTTPFPDGPNALFSKIHQAVEHYNMTPQSALGGKSPHQLWQAAVDRGWRPARIGRETAEEALVRIETRTVRQGAVRIGGVEFLSDELCSEPGLEGEAVTVHLPLCDGFPPAVYAPDGRFVSLVYPRRSYAFMDPAGAREAARVKQLRKQGARDIARGVPPAELPAYQAAFLERYPAPNDAIAGEVVELDNERGRAVAARRRDAKGSALSGAATLPAPGDGPDDEYFAMLAAKVVAEADGAAAGRQEKKLAEGEELRALARDIVRKAEGRTGT